MRSPRRHIGVQDWEIKKARLKLHVISFLYLYLVLTMKKGVVREKKKIGKSESNWEKEDQWKKHKGGGATASPSRCSGLSQLLHLQHPELRVMTSPRDTLGCTIDS